MILSAVGGRDALRMPKSWISWNAAPPVNFSNRRATLALDTRGAAVSLRSKKNGRELLAQPQPLVSARLKDGRQLSARKASRAGNTLTFEFPRGLGSAVLAVENHRDFFTFTVRSLTLTNVASLTFCSTKFINKSIISHANFFPPNRQRRSTAIGSMGDGGFMA